MNENKAHLDEKAVSDGAAAMENSVSSEVQPPSPEKTAGRKGRAFVLRVIGAVFGVLLAAVCGLGLWFAAETTQTVTAEVGEKVSLDALWEDPFLCSLYRVKSVPEDMTIPRDYIARLRFFGFYDKSLVIQVRDKKPPEFSVRDVHSLEGVMPSPEDFIASLRDDSEVTFRFEGDLPVHQPGEHEITVIAHDFYGNSAKKTAFLKVWEASHGISVDLNKENAEDAVRRKFPDLTEMTLTPSAEHEYTLHAMAEDGIYLWRVCLTDNLAPEVIAHDLCLRLGETVDAEAFFSEITDASSFTATYDTEPDFESTGCCSVVLNVEDSFGNRTTVQAEMLICDLPTEHRVELGFAAEDVFAELLSSEGMDDLEQYFLPFDVPSDEKGRVPLGSHALLLETELGSYTVDFTVEDTVSPEFEAEDLMVYTGKPVSADDFVTQWGDEGEVTFSFEAEPSTESEGEYPVVVIAADESGNRSSKSAVMTVRVDTEPPQLHGVGPLFLYVGQQTDYLHGVHATDNRDGELPVAVDAAEVDTNTVGTYVVTYSCTDEGGNRAEMSASVEVVVDTEPPVISGAKDQSILVGETVSFRKGVYAEDALAGAVAVKVDSSAVNTYAEGVYPVYYSSTDPSGNTAYVTVYLTVRLSDMDKVNNMADWILSQITTPYMTEYEKAWAVYSWCTSNLYYSTRTSYLMGDFAKGAYSGFTLRSGNCYIYYAVARALLTRAGIENMEIQRNDPNNPHYWNLVKVNGAWYHFDTCPHYSGHWIQSFLLTDAQVRAYSEYEVPGYYNFDPGLYPATP